ncbi:MAG: branched-chain amino acid ABC transporter permease [Solirubrobacterales bacterium]
MPSSPGARRRPSALAVLLALFIVLAAGAPFYLSELQLFTAARMVILALFAVSLNLLLGRTGLVSFAHAAYFGVGAYAVALLSLHLELSPLLGVALALPVGAAFALVTGVVALRAVRLYFALLTLALSQLIYVIVFQWYDFTRGDNGIHGIEGPEFLDSVVWSYWTVFAIAAVGVAAIWLIGRSPFGAALEAIRENRQRAAFIGIDVKRYELASFVVAGAFGALAGSLFALFNREAYPNLLFWTANALPIFICLIGGLRWLVAGPVVGAIAYVLLEEGVTRNTQYPDLILGAILLAIVLLAPGGLIDVGERLLDRVRRRRTSGPSPRLGEGVSAPGDAGGTLASDPEARPPRLEAPT